MSNRQIHDSSSSSSSSTSGVAAPVSPLNASPRTLARLRSTGSLSHRRRSTLADSIEAVRVPEVEDETNEVHETPQQQQQHPSSNINSSSTQNEEIELMKSNNSTVAAIDPLADNKNAKLAATKKFFTQKFNQINDTVQEQGPKLVSVLRGSNVATGPVVADAMLESLNYDNHLDVQAEDVLETSAAQGGQNTQSRTSQTFHTWSLRLLKFLITILISFLTAMLFWLVSSLTSFLQTHRVDSVARLLTNETWAGAYFLWLFSALVLTFIASSLVIFVAPYARGGGVPYVFAYLNGTNVSAYFTRRVVLIKAAAVAFTISGGLPLGMEGPFVYLGGGIALLVSKMLDLIPSFGSHGRYTRVLRNIKEERIFMSGGIAAGLTCAFNAPITGVLFAMEGTSAFLTVPVTLRIFACAMFAMFFSDLAHVNFSSNIKSHNLITISDDPDAVDYIWLVPEIVAFTIIGVLGGVLGAAATRINVTFTRWRHHSCEGRMMINLGEVAVITTTVATIWFIVPLVFGCRPLLDSCAAPGASAYDLQRCRTLWCDAGQYSELGSIIYSPSDVVLRMFFDRNVSSEHEYSAAALLVYGLLYFVLASWTYGAHATVGGTFVPAIIVGGTYGRVVGSVGRHYISASINPGVYSLIGAASMLGGFTRLVMPITLMVVEMTGDATYLLPIMYCASIAKFLADFIEVPLYPQHMALEKIPVLGDKLPASISSLTASDIMSQTYGCVEEYACLEDLLDTLDKSKHSMLPVIDSEQRFVGMIQRASLVHALQNSPMYGSKAAAQKAARDAAALDAGLPVSPEAPSSPTSPSQAQTTPRHRVSASRTVIGNVNELLSDWSDTTDYAATLTKFDDSLLQRIIDLSVHTDVGSLTAHAETSVKRVAALFRRCGISHLCVTSIDNKLLGVITRRHLLGAPSSDAVDDDHAEVKSPLDHDNEPVLSPSVQSPKSAQSRESDSSAGDENTNPNAQPSSPSRFIRHAQQGSISQTAFGGRDRRNSSIDSASSSVSTDSVSIRVNGKPSSARPRLVRQKTALQRIAQHTKEIR